MRVTTAGTNENLLRLVSVPGHGARVLPLELVPVPGHGARVLPLELVPVLGHGARVLPLELVPLPGHGAQISARAPTKGCVQTCARARFNEPDLDLPKETHLIQSVLLSAHNKNV